VKNIINQLPRPISAEDPMDEPGLDPENHIPLKVIRSD